MQPDSNRFIHCKNCFHRNLTKLSGLIYYLMTRSQSGFTLLSVFELICAGEKKRVLLPLC